MGLTDYRCTCFAFAFNPLAQEEGRFVGTFCIKLLFKQMQDTIEVAIAGEQTIIHMNRKETTFLPFSLDKHGMIVRCASKTGFAEPLSEDAVPFAAHLTESIESPL